MFLLLAHMGNTARTKLLQAIDKNFATDSLHTPTMPQLPMTSHNIVYFTFLKPLKMRLYIYILSKNVLFMSKKTSPY